MKGIIYKLVFPDGKFYIGSTTRDLRERFWDHKKCANPDNATVRHQPLYEHWRKFSINTVTIECLEELECSHKDIRFIESEYINLFNADEDCLNQCKAYLTPEQEQEWKRQYRQTNLEALRSYDRAWKKEKRKMKQRQ